MRLVSIRAKIVSKYQIAKTLRLAYRVYRRPETGIWPSMNYEEICSKLRDAGFEEDVIDIFKRNRIDVPVFLEIGSEEFIQLKVDALGDRKRLISLQREIKSKVETV